MLIDRYEPEDVFARVPEMAARTDPVLKQIDRMLDDDLLFQQVKADLIRRYPQTAGHGRHSTPAEVLLRLFVVKHLHNWSFAETEQWVSDSLALRWFTRVYFHPVPDDTTLIRWAATIRPATLHALNDRVSALAKELRLTKGRKLRQDGTVVQTPIHHPTDSSLLGDGVRVLSRLLRRSKTVVGDDLRGVRDAFRSRLRTMRQGLRALHRAARQKGAAAEEQRRALYRKIITTAEQTVVQAQRVCRALAETPALATRTAERLHEAFDRFVPRVEQVIRQARQRVLEGRQVPAAEKILSLFEPHTRIIQRHKSGTPVEFGRLVMLDEVEGGIVTRYHILGDGESEHGQVGPALAHHQEVFGHAPRVFTGDRGTHAPDNERLAHAAGVKHLVIPWSGKTTPERRARETSRTWRRHYRWRAGIEGRISSLQRDFGLERCAYHGEAGMERGVGWGIIASNLDHIGQAMAERAGQPQQRAA